MTPTFCYIDFNSYHLGRLGQISEKWCFRIGLLLCTKQNKASIMSSESLKCLILQNYSQKIVLVRWFIVQLDFIAWFIEYSVIWHICPGPSRREDDSLWSFLPTLNQWWLQKLIYHGPGLFAAELFILGSEKTPSLLCTFIKWEWWWLTFRDYMNIWKRTTNQSTVK